VSAGDLRFANINSRASLIIAATDDGGGTAVDLETASDGAFPSDPMACLARWSEVRAFASSRRGDARRFEAADLAAPSPRPAQVFGIGLNYREHAVETAATIPTTPLTFTKFASSINAPHGDIVIDVPTADWEVELVAVIGAGGRNIGLARAWDAVAGLCVGQDVSDRLLQRATQPPQFSLGKSRRGYSPFGPWLVDAASVAARDALTMHCTLDGEEVQRTLTDDMIFTVPQLVAYLSTIVELLPGDVIYTGTPNGVGAARTPPRFLQPGNVIISGIDGIGSITNRCVSARRSPAQERNRDALADAARQSLTRRGSR
jgi:2-keto-4-pentenoate hydratase/2-oxohepta-3-ene-1,7-dioic acid hydratase in catechol pathway